MYANFMLGIDQDIKAPMVQVSTRIRTFFDLLQLAIKTLLHSYAQMPVYIGLGHNMINASYIIKYGVASKCCCFFVRIWRT